MQENAKCDRCGQDTGKRCDGGDHLDIPMQLDLNVPGSRRDMLRFIKHIHLCAKCLDALREWWHAGRKGGS